MSEPPVIKHIRKGGIIKLQVAKGKKHCPDHYELKYANGCQFECQWCDLNGIFRFSENFNAPRLKNEIEIKHDVREALARIRPQAMFNCGAKSDGLAFEAMLINDIIPLFKDEHLNEVGHKLLIHTSSDSKRVGRTLSQNVVVMSHSLNATWMSATWEHRAPHPINRLAASKYYAEQGYETRLQIGPIAPEENWHAGYRELVEKIMNMNPHAKVITLNSLHGRTSTINACDKRGHDIRWTKYLDQDNKQVPVEKRVEMYRLIRDVLKEFGYEGELALCEESGSVWKKVGLNPKTTTCNCTLKRR